MCVFLSQDKLQIIEILSHSHFFIPIFYRQRFSYGDALVAMLASSTKTQEANKEAEKAIREQEGSKK